MGISILIRWCLSIEMHPRISLYHSPIQNHSWLSCKKTTYFTGLCCVLDIEDRGMSATSKAKPVALKSWHERFDIGYHIETIFSNMLCRMKVTVLHYKFYSILLLTPNRQHAITWTNIWPLSLIPDFKDPQIDVNQISIWHFRAGSISYQYRFEGLSIRGCHMLSLGHKWVLQMTKILGVDNILTANALVPNVTGPSVVMIL